MNGQPTITIGRAAQILAVSPDTIRRWVDRGIIRGYRLPTGQRRLFAEGVDQVRHDMLAGTAHWVAFADHEPNSPAEKSSAPTAVWEGPGNVQG